MAPTIALAAPLPDLTQCEAEPIHIPGAIQPHGVLLALYGASLDITQASANASTLLGLAAADLAGCELATLGPGLAEALREALARYRELPAVPASFTWRAPSGGTFTGYVHQCDDLVVLELEPALAAFGTVLAEAVRGFSAVHAQSALPAKLQCAAELFRRLTGYDRVMIYRFDEDWHGEVVAEARRAELEPYLGLHWPASDIPAQARRLYLINHTRVIVDVDYQASPLLPVLNPVTGQPLDLSRSTLRAASPVHLEYLRNMGVRSTLTTSLLREGQLWGLIACHHATPLPVSGEIRQIADWMGQDLATQIALAQALDVGRYAAHLKQCRDRIIAAMRRGARLSALLRGPELADILGASGAEGVALVHGDEVTTGGQTPDRQEVLAIVAGLTSLHQDGSADLDLFATDCLSATLTATTDLAATAAGVALFPLNAAQSAKFLWFRGEQLRQVTWGGNPDKAVDLTPDGRLSPRRSFAAWSQIVRLHSRQWRPEELDSVRKLGALIDIEWRRLAEDALRASEALLSDVLDSLSAHIAVLNGQGIITLVNAAWLRFAEANGGSLDCLTGTDYLEVCRGVLSGQDGVEAAAALHGIQQVLDGTRGSFRLVYPCDSPTEARWFEMVAFPISGTHAGVVVAHEEITAHKLAETALHASEERLRLVLEGANDGFWDWNLVTGDLSVSPRWAQILGYDLAEIEPNSRGWERLVHPDDLPRVQAEVQAHLDGTTARFESEHRMLTKDGDWRWVLARAKVTARDAAGRPLRMAGTNTDITERRRAEEALRLSLAEVRRHDARMVALNRMNDLLLSCETPQEAYAVIAEGAEVLFAPCSGALAVSDGAPSELHRVAAWGAADSLPPAFALHDCWALRRGQPHGIGPAGDEIACRHVPAQPPPASVCVPLNVRGASLGLLHVAAAEPLSESQFQELRTLAVTVGESIKLALSNLRLRQALRDAGRLLV